MNEATSELSLLPSGFLDQLKDVTIGNLVNSPEAELHYKAGKLSVRKQLSDRVISLEIASYETGYQTATCSCSPARGRKSDHLHDILRMRKEGMIQKDIAFRLAMSPSYVSRLLKNAEK